MTKFLNELITDKTKILDLSNNEKASKFEKQKVLDMETYLEFRYINSMYKQNGNWYYLKKDDDNPAYPFFIIDELMGTYLAKNRNLKTITYEIAKRKNSLGLASLNFKDDKHTYHIISKLLKDESNPNSSFERIDLLKQFCINLENEEEFMKDLLNIFALDIHMLQKDRGEVNLQFQIDKDTNHFAIAPLYDYSNCSRTVTLSGLSIPSKIIRINDITVYSLIKKFPYFKECLEFCLEQHMSKIFDQICEDYNFNKECSAYERLKDYYEIKDEKQHEYIKTLTKKL
ncbi:MAG: hypothetical protein E7170_00180 [Firmicutes bacterium]|nr:hypothetical protein [Bacillota bacterium]